MRHIVMILTLLTLLTPHPAKAGWESSARFQTTQESTISIQSPILGQALQGSVTINGNSAVEGFQSSEVSFAYAHDSTDTWFLIQYSTLPVQDGMLATWDTTTITDGNYSLRLVVLLTDGTQVTQQVNGLRVRNYSPIETDTPTPAAPSLTPAPGTPTSYAPPTITPSPSLTPPHPTPTPLPTNPAEISTTEAIVTLGKGAMIAIVLFVILGGYLGIRAALRKRT